MASPLDEAEIFEVYPNRWVSYTSTRDSEEADRELALYVAMDATQQELLDFVANEAGLVPRRVLYTGPEGDVVPGFLYLDFGITLVRSVAADEELPAGGMRRDAFRAAVGVLHRHFPGAPASYLWAYAAHNGLHPSAESLIGVALVGVPGPHAYALERRGEGPRLATVTRVALDHQLPAEVTYGAASKIYDAAAKEAHRRGYDFLETYTLASESAKSLRYSTWRPPGISNKEGRWRKVGWSRPRKKGRRGAERTAEQAQGKWRWWKRLTDKWDWPPRPNPDPAELDWSDEGDEDIDPDYPDGVDWSDRAWGIST